MKIIRKATEMIWGNIVALTVADYYFERRKQE